MSVFNEFDHQCEHIWILTRKNHLEVADIFPLESQWRLLWGWRNAHRCCDVGCSYKARRGQSTGSWAGKDPPRSVAPSSRGRVSYRSLWRGRGAELPGRKQKNDPVTERNPAVASPALQKKRWRAQIQGGSSSKPPDISDSLSTKWFDVVYYGDRVKEYIVWVRQKEKEESSQTTTRPPTPLHLGAGALVGVFPRLQRAGSQRRQLGLEHGDAPPRGRHELEGGLQRRAQRAVGLLAVAEHARQRRQQVLHQLGREGGGDNERAVRRQEEDRSRLCAGKKQRLRTSLLSFRFTIRLSWDGMKMSESKQKKPHVWSQRHLLEGLL